MSNIRKYLVRRLTIISNDGQSHNYGLSYLTAEEEEGCLRNLEIKPFDRERAGVVFVDSLTLKEESRGLFKVFGI